ncbi:MAG: cytochrome c [Rhizobiales bacterium]|nr:cytochrome c [Hyphomicrobiales bacterium]
MLRKLLILVVGLAAIGGGAFYVLTIPRTLAATDLPDHKADLANGETMFWAGGCESCHAAVDAKGEDLKKLGGGRSLATPFGTFHVPNISSDKEHGIGAWSTLDFVNAMKMGIGPGGTHLYPAFPYTSYQRMKIEDLIDLKGYLDTLPAVASVVPPHDLPFPFSVRRGLGLWQLLYVDGKTLAPDPKATAPINRGAYLVEGPGHCGECHTPRNLIGGRQASLSLAGGPAPEGDGHIPNITPDEATGIGRWSHDEIVQALSTGFTPDFDALGGDMAAVVQNIGHLTAEDQNAMADYLKAIPPINNPKPQK